MSSAKTIQPPQGHSVLCIVVSNLPALHVSLCDDLRKFINMLTDMIWKFNVIVPIFMFHKFMIRKKTLLQSVLTQKNIYKEVGNYFFSTRKFYQATCQISHPISVLGRQHVCVMDLCLCVGHQSGPCVPKQPGTNIFLCPEDSVIGAAKFVHLCLCVYEYF